jgi:hypothetical protein
MLPIDQFRISPQIHTSPCGIDSRRRLLWFSRAGICAVKVFALAACFLVSRGMAADELVIPKDALKLVDEILPDKPSEAEFREYPEGASKVEPILDRSARVHTNDSDEMKYFAYNIGKGKGLKAGAAYLLTVEYPEDKPRTMYILHRGNESGRGISTGDVVADNLFGKYVDNNSESIAYPLSGKWQTWQHFFYLHDRFPEFESLRGENPRPKTPADGFWVVIAQTNQTDALGSAGIAVGAIRLYEVVNPEAAALKINYPPEELPRRYIFCREEMADGVVSVPHGPDKPENRGIDRPVDWFEYKARNMRFLGMNTFTTDLLEFGHNQGWDAKDSNWYVASSSPKRWEEILDMLKRYPDLSVLPYYEYGGGTGPEAVGRKRKPIRLAGDKEYIHLKWLNENAHIDILDPEALADAKRLLDETVLRFKEDTRFIGAWFRARPVQMPLSFSDENLALYKEEAGEEVKRETLRANKDAKAKYEEWWFAKRHAFLKALTDYLREKGLPEAIVLFTPDASEPGKPFKDNVLVTDAPEVWKKRMAASPKKKEVLSFDEVVKNDLHRKGLSSPVSTWGGWEWDHAIPSADPKHYEDKDGTIISYTFNRLYTVSSPSTFDGYHDKDGMAIVRHHSLNENTLDDKVGYFIGDLEVAGPYSMLAEARAMANGDPRYIGYLISNTLVRGFPQYVREFNRAFLSLPALPSVAVAGASTDEEVVVREIEAGKHGTYYAVVNTSLHSKNKVQIKLPKNGTITNAATGEAMTASDGMIELEFYPGQLVSLHVK